MGNWNLEFYIIYYIIMLFIYLSTQLQYHAPSIVSQKRFSYDDTSVGLPLSVLDADWPCTSAAAFALQSQSSTNVHRMGKARAPPPPYPTSATESTDASRVHMQQVILICVLSLFGFF